LLLTDKRSKKGFFQRISRYSKNTCKTDDRNSDLVYCKLISKGQHRLNISSEKRILKIDALKFPFVSTLHFLNDGPLWWFSGS